MNQRLDVRHEVDFREPDRRWLLWSVSEHFGERGSRESPASFTTTSMASWPFGVRAHRSAHDDQRSRKSRLVAPPFAAPRLRAD